MQHAFALARHAAHFEQICEIGAVFDGELNRDRRQAVVAEF